MPWRPRAGIDPRRRTGGEESGDAPKVAGSGFGKGFKAISYTVASPGKIAKLPNKRKDKKQEREAGTEELATSASTWSHSSSTFLSHSAMFLQRPAVPTGSADKE